MVPLMELKSSFQIPPAQGMVPSSIFFIAGDRWERGNLSIFNTF
jgi:hypothetical protein